MAKATHGKKLNARLYLDGQRVPIQSISTSGSENNHLRASITVPPAPMVRNLKPRTVVEVFVKENRDEEFHLFFEGEYIGYRNTENAGAKTFSLECVGLTNFWETVYQFFINKLSPASIGQQEVASFVSGGAVGEGPSLSSVNITLPKDIFGNYVIQALMRNGSDVQQAMLDAVHLMANMSGKQNGNVKEPRINSQIEKAFVNLRLGERVFVLPDENIKRLIGLKNAKAVIEQISGTLADFSSLAGVISTFLGFVYYDWVPMMSPPFTDRGRNAGTADSVGLDYVRPVQFSGKGAPDARPTTSSIIDELSSQSTISDRPMSSAKVQRDVVFKPKTYFLPPPSCNLVFPAMFDSLNAGRLFLQEPTRIRVRTQPLPGSSDINIFNTFSYYAPAEIQVPLKREETTSAQYVVRDSTDKAVTERKTKTEVPIVHRYESLVVQEGVGAIDETITGVIPAFDELGFAEYSAIKLASRPADTAGTVNDLPDKKTAGSGDNNKEEEQSRQVKARANGTLLNKVPAEFRDLHNYFAQIAQFKLDLVRAQQRVVEGVSGPYNRNLALGFPGMVFSNTGIYAGTIASENRIIDTNGQAFSTFTLGLVREISMLPGIVIGTSEEMALLEISLRSFSAKASSRSTLADFRSEVAEVAQGLGDIRTSTKRIELLTSGFDPVDHTPEQPAWLSESYQPETIGASVYKPLFGNRTKDKPVQSLLELANIAGTNQVLAANIMFLQYKLNPNRVAFIQEITTRGVATATEVMSEFLGVGAPSEQLPDRSTGMVVEDLTDGVLTFGETVSSTKANAGEEIEDPFIPFQKKRVEPVREYVNFLAASRSKGFRG